MNMKKRLLLRVLCLMLVACLLAACGNGGGTTPEAPPPGSDTPAAGGSSDAGSGATDNQGTDDGHLEITFFLWGEKPNQMDDVADYFNQTGGAELNMTLLTNWTPLDDFATMIRLRHSAGEPVDAHFDAQWLTMLDYIRDDMLHDLSPYFMNPAYQGLYNAFDANLLANNMFGTGKTYGVPITQSFDTAPLVLIRADLREKYDIPVVDSLESYRVFLQTIQENEPHMVPLGINVEERWTDTIVHWSNDLWRYDRIKAGVWADNIRVSSDINVGFYVVDYQIQAVALTIDTNEAFAAFPSGFSSRDYEIMTGTFAREFFENRWIDQDFLSATDHRGIFTSGRGASAIWDTANYAGMVTDLSVTLPEARVETFQPSNALRDGLKGILPGNFQAWNFICVPVTTPPEKLDKIMEFYNWLFSSWDNHGLIELGIQGVHWEPIGTDQFRLADGVDPATTYNFPGYQLTWNANFIRLSAELPDDVLLYTQRGNDPDSYFNPMFSGFSFDNSVVEMELANPDLATFKAERDNIIWGLFPNTEQALFDLSERVAANSRLMEDIEAIKAALWEQAQAYLLERKILDEQTGLVY
jgi:putative aldouronate transport system substrate-binding protein